MRIAENLKKILYDINPKLLASVEFFYSFHRFLNWKNPKDLNEKINWLKFNSDTSLWTLCADKYRVRQYIVDKGLSEILVDIYGVWDNAESISWDGLPDKFVMKVNNGSGDVLICKDKSKLDIPYYESVFDKLMHKDFGDYNGEPHYANIKPCIIAEELLDCTKQSIETDTLIDYKIWCFNGKPFCVWACHNRHKDSVEVGTYDLNWNYMPKASVFTEHYKESSKILPRPKSLDKMIEYAAILSDGFPQVRVDMYEVDGNPYFGEMTFTSAGGFMDFYTKDFLKEMGDLVDLSLAKKRSNQL